MAGGPRARIGETLSETTAAGRGARWHPLVVACLLLIGIRALALVLHFTSRDPNGNPVSASPFESLLIAIPYHGWILLTTAGVLLLLWTLLPRLRPAVTAVGIVVALAGIVLGQVDLGMQWFIGQRFSPVAASTYVGGSLLSSDWLAPLRFHPGYLATGLALMLAPWALIGWSLWAARPGACARPMADGGSVRARRAVPDPARAGVRAPA